MADSISWLDTGAPLSVVPLHVHTTDAFFFLDPSALRRTPWDEGGIMETSSPARRVSAGARPVRGLLGGRAAPAAVCTFLHGQAAAARSTRRCSWYPWSPFVKLA